MNHNAIKIAIAEACDWTRVRSNPHGSGGSRLQHDEADLLVWEFNWVPPQFKGHKDWARPLPNYPLDLNEVRNALTYLHEHEGREFMNDYERALCEFLASKDDLPNDAIEPWQIMLATPMEHCQAILAALELQKTNPNGC